MLPAGADTALLVEFEAADEPELDHKFAALAAAPENHCRPADGTRREPG